MNTHTAQESAEPQRSEPQSTERQPCERITESAFRAGVPRRIGIVEILEVTRFEPGDRRHYAQAAALGLNHDGRYVTHTVIYQDDAETYVLHAGHYGIRTRAEAEDDARTRWLG